MCVREGEGERETYDWTILFDWFWVGGYYFEDQSYLKCLVKSLLYFFSFLFRLVLQLNYIAYRLNNLRWKINLQYICQWHLKCCAILSSPYYYIETLFSLLFFCLWHIPSLHFICILFYNIQILFKLGFKQVKNV